MENLSGLVINVIIAIAIFIIGKMLAKWIANKSVKILSLSSEINETLANFLSSVIYGALLVVVVISALGQVGVETTSFIAIVGALGLAIGLSFKDTLSNISAGVMIALFQPIKLGEFVEAGGEAGVVEDINIFNTVLKTGDNKTIIIGIAKIIGGNITNFSRKDTRRVDMVFGIGYDDDLKLAKDTILKILHNDERVINEPAEPFVAVKELADSSVNIVARAWVKSGDYWGVYFDTLEKVKLTFDKKGISIPYPQMDIHKIK
jgi:small conductance mechanosensitive channel